MSKYEIKNAEEKEFLYKFLQTIVGKNLFKENNITKIVKSEAPDFLLETYDSQTLALEITQFIAQNKDIMPTFMLFTKIILFLIFRLFQQSKQLFIKNQDR